MDESLNRLEEVTLRLAAIRDELLALPEGPSPERFKLLTEQDALRAEASAFAEDADSHRSTEELKAALDSLTQRRRAILESRSGYVQQGRGANGRCVGRCRGESPVGSAHRTSERPYLGDRG